MTIDPWDAATWTILSQTTVAERRLLAVFGWLSAIAHLGRR